MTDESTHASTTSPKPMGMVSSILYFGIPAAIFSASILWLLPIMVRGGFGNLLIFNVTFGGPLLLMLVAALVVYRMEGNLWNWHAFRDRMRLTRLSGKDWLWTVGLLVAMYAGSYLISPLVSVFSDWIIYTAPEEFINFRAGMADGSFGGMDMQGRWDIFVWILLTVTILNIGGEELWWRGIILPRQELVFGKWAWLVNGLLWDLFHIFYHTTFGSVIAFIPVTVFLAFVAQRTSNTWPAIIAHWIGNTGILIAVGSRVMG